MGKRKKKLDQIDQNKEWKGRIEIGWCLGREGQRRGRIQEEKDREGVRIQEGICVEMGGIQKEKDGEEGRFRKRRMMKEANLEKGG